MATSIASIAGVAELVHPHVQRQLAEAAYVLCFEPMLAGVSPMRAPSSLLHGSAERHG